MNTLKQLPELTALVEAGKNPFNQVLMDYVDQGGKTVGFMYQDTPEEIITAAGAAPIYLRGTASEGTEMAEAFFRQLTCNYTKHTYNEILDGKWDFLDGAVLYNLCDHSRRIYDNWKTIPGNPAYHFMYVPKKRSGLSKDFYREEINKLIKATEEHFGVEITKDKLAEAIKLHNETRRLQQEIYEMQKGEEVYLTGLELLMVMLAGVSLPRPEYNKMMKDLIAALKANGPRVKPKVRLLYTGGHADNPEFFDLLQQNDAHVVSDNTGFGTRAADVLIREDGEPLEAIIDYYFEEKPAATRQMGTQVERMERLLDLVKQYKADGVVASRLYMCDLWAFEHFLMRKRLHENNVPFLELEVDYTPEGQGQIKTRVQAFVESLADRQTA
jgi:benzoyl-CoA reductase subunit C